MESRAAVVEQIAQTPAVPLQRMERAQRVHFGWLFGITPGGFTMMLGALGALLCVIADGLHQL